MQTRLTPKKSKLTKRRKAGVGLLICVVLVSLVVLLLSMVGQRKSVDDYLKEINIYLVVVGENLDENSAIKMGKKVEEFGGAGVLYSQENDNQYCVVLFAYKNLNDAEKILESSKTIFPDCYIIAKNYREISNSIQSKIKNSGNISYALNLIWSEADKTVNTLYLYEKGELSYIGVHRYAVELLWKLQEINNKLAIDGELEEEVMTSILVIENEVRLFIDKTFELENAIKYFKKVCVTFALEQINLRRVLN